MIYYFLILFLVVFWIYLEAKSLRRKAIIVPILLLSLYAGIRHYSVGSDTKNYVRNFLNEIFPILSFNDDGREIGYQIFEYFILSLTHNYFWLLFLSAFIVVSCYLSFFKKYSNNYCLSVFIFITFNLYTFFFNGLRQGIAMAIAVWSLPYIIQKKPVKFILILIISSLIHQSSLVIILFYFILNLKFKLEYKILSVFIGSFVFSGLTLQYLAATNERYSSYAEESSKSGGYLTLSLYVIVGLISFFWYKKYNFSNYFISKINEFYLCGIAFVIPIALLGASASGPQRLLYYFSWCSCLLIPYILKYINSLYVYLLFMIFSVIYFYLFTSGYANLSPYSINDSLRIF